MFKWPLAIPKNYTSILKKAFTAKEMEKLEKSETKGAPFGDDEYVQKMIEEHNLGYTQRGVGRPKRDQ